MSTNAIFGNESRKFFRTSKKTSVFAIFAPFIELDFFAVFFPFFFYTSTFLLIIMIIGLIFSILKNKPANIASTFFSNLVFGGSICILLVISLTSGLATWAYNNGSDTIADQIIYSIAGDVKTIADNTDKLVENTQNLKKETSENPRKELNNYGIAWNQENYRVQVHAGDILNLTLFFEGGMNPYVGVTSNASSYIADSFVIAFRNKNFSKAKEIVTLATKYGYLPSKDTGFLKKLIDYNIIKENFELFTEYVDFFISIDNDALNTLKTLTQNNIEEKTKDREWRLIEIEKLKKHGRITSEVIKKHRSYYDTFGHQLVKLNEMQTYLDSL